MKKIRFFLSLLFFVISFCSMSQDWLWAKQSYLNFPKRIIEDDHQNYYVSGRSSSVSSLSKFNHNGDSLWLRHFPYEIRDIVYRDGYLYFIKDGMQILKLDTLGNTMWQISLNGVYEGLAMTIDNSSDIYITATMNDTLILGTDTLIPSGLLPTFITKIDTAGTFLWSKILGHELHFDKLICYGDHLYGTGRFTGAQLIDTVQLISNGGYDVFISKFDLLGNCLWAKNGGGKNTYSYQRDEGYDISAANENLYITGSVNDTATFDTIVLNSSRHYNDVFIAKYTTGGSAKWVKRFGQWSDAEGRAVAADTNGYIYFGGSYVGPITIGSTTLPGIGNYDLFLTKIDSSGTILWSKYGGGSTWNDYVNSILIDAQHDILFCGQYSNTAFLGPDTLNINEVPGASGYIAKISTLVGLNEISNTFSDMNSYPNPFHSSFTVELNHTDPDISIEIYSAEGRIVYSEKIRDHSARLLKQINISELSKGLYLLKVQSGNEVCNRRVLKQ